MFYIHQAIHGFRGDIDKYNSMNRSSPWLDIIRDLTYLKRKGIDLLALVRKKMGSGENSLFWDDIW